MTPCGLPSQETSSITADHLFFERLKLLIIMTKAGLKGYPIGQARARAIHQNAEFVFHQSLSRFSRARDGGKDSSIDVFYQRTQLLAEMASTIANGKLEGGYRKRAVAENIDRICDYLCAQLHWADAPFLKVA